MKTQNTAPVLAGLFVTALLTSLASSEMQALKQAVAALRPQDEGTVTVPTAR
ncbi:MAG: hypothetical protein ABIS50_11030 [Luteolibacter sp.]|uniref:hypothetical protein n=1 Tax=Luteolibacter sp. TaxID=1962973 RepID=UPI00326352DB